MVEEDFSTDQLYGRLLALATPSVVRRTLQGYMAEHAPLLVKARQLLRLPGASTGASLTPADLKAGGLTAALLVAPVPEGCGLTLEELLDEGILARSDEGLVALVKDLGLTLDMVLPASPGLRGAYALPALAAAFGGREVVQRGLLAGGFGVDDTVWLDPKWMPRLRPADWHVLGGLKLGKQARRRAFMGPNDDGTALRTMLGAAKPHAWARKAGLKREHLLCLEWGLGSTLQAAAAKLGWDPVETERAFPPSAAGPRRAAGGRQEQLEEQLLEDFLQGKQ